QIRIITLNAINDRRQVGRRVEHRTIRLEKYERRHLPAIASFAHRYDECTLASLCNMPLLQIVDHRRNERIDIRLAFPQIEAHAEARKFASQPLFGNFEEMAPKSAITGPAPL